MIQNYYDLRHRLRIRGILTLGLCYFKAGCD